MAIARKVLYTLTFDTNTGSQIEYELDIIGDAEDTDPDFMDAAIGLIGTSNPIEIKWDADKGRNGIYKPIVGSSANLNFVIPDDQFNLIDFNAGREKEFEVILRYRTTGTTASEGERVTGITFETYDGDPLNDIAISNTSEDFANVQITTTADRDDTTPVIGAANAGRNLYASTDSGTTVVFVGTIRSDTGMNGNQARIRVDGGGDADAARDRINAAVNPGAEVWLAGVGDTGVATSFVGSDMQNYWCGHITPLDGSESVSTYPFTVSFKATDGLGLLEQFPVEAQTTNEKQSVFTWIHQSLRQTALELPIYIDSGLRVSRTPGDFTQSFTANNGNRVFILRELTTDISSVTVNGTAVTDFENAFGRITLPTAPADGVSVVINYSVPASSDGLLASLAGVSSFYNDDKTERNTLKEALSQTAETFNCKVFQSRGRWYVVNNSTHGGVGSTESTTFATFNPDGSYIGDVTEDLLYSINGTSTQDLTPANSDLTLNTLRPAGSVQADFTNLTGISYVDNPNFNPDSAGNVNGWLAAPLSTNQDLTFSNDVALSGIQSIFTNRNVHSSDGFEDLWFESDGTIEIERGFPVRISFQHQLRSIANNISSSNLRYQLYLEFNTDFIYEELTEGDNQFEEAPGITASLIYNFESGLWEPTLLDFRPDERYSNEIVISTERTWQEHDFTTAPLPDGIYSNGWIRFSPRDGAGEGVIKIRFYYPEAVTTDDENISQGSNSIMLFIDSVNVRSSFQNGEDSPVFERIQNKYTSTINYEPKFISVGQEAFEQRLTQNTFYRPEVTGEDGSQLSLGRLITQQKLNDYSAQLKYYEGTLINQNATPVSPHNKILIDYNDNGIIYSETNSCIINGGTFRPKQNTFDIAMYVPNQTTDVAEGDGVEAADGTLGEGFYERNIELVAAPFTGREGLITYSANVDVIGTDGTNPIIPNPISSNRTSFAISGIARQIVEGTLLLNTTDAFIANASNFTVQGTTPTFLTVDSIVDQADGISVNYTVVIPPRPEFETLTISGEVDPVTENTQQFNIGVSSTDPQGNITLTSLPVRGESGNPRTIQVIISPDPGRQLVTDNFAFTLSDTDILMDAGVLERGSGLEWNITVLIPDTAPPPITPGSDPEIAFTATVTNVDDRASTSVDDLTFTLDIREISPNITNLSVSTTNIPITGAADDTFTHHIRVSPAPGFILDESNDRTLSPHANAGFIDPVQDGYGYLIPITGTIPATDGQTAIITVDYDGVIQKIDADVVTTTIDFVTVVDGTPTLVGAVIDELAQETPSSIRNSVGNNRFTIIPTSGRRFVAGSNIPTITYTGDVRALGTPMLNTDGTVTVRYEIIYGAVDSPIDLGANTIDNAITITGTSLEAPFTAFVNINTSLLTQTVAPAQITRGFDGSDVGNSLTGFTFRLLPTEENRMFATSPTLSAVAGTTITGVSGVIDPANSAFVDYTFSVTLANLPQDQVFNVALSASPIQLQPATAATTLMRLGGNLPAMGGSSQFRLIADGAWTIVASVIGAGNPNVVATGSYSETVTTSTGLSITTTGTFGPVSGGAGEHTITVNADPRPFDFGPVQTSGSIEFHAFSANNGVTLNVMSDSGVEPVATANVTLQNALGGRTVTFPPGVDEAVLMSISGNYDNWIFQS